MADELSSSLENTGMKEWVRGILGCAEPLFNHLADAINSKLKRICPFCQNIRMGLELHNARSDALFSSLLDAVETLKPLFGKAMYKDPTCLWNFHQSKHCSMEELGDFIQLVSEDGKEIHSGSNLKALQLHKLDFLKDFISFAASRGVGEDKLQDFLVHTEVIITTAASLSYMLWRPQVMDGTKMSFIYSQYSEILKVMPVIILKASRSSRSLDDTWMDDDFLFEAYINSLLENHLELLASNSSFTVSVMKILTKELRFLRYFLKYQIPEGADLDEEIANLICDVISEARMLFCSLSLGDVKEDIELGLSNWIDKVQFVKQDVTNKYMETNELGPIFIAPKLSDSTLELPDSTRKLSDSTQKLSELIYTLRSYLAWLEDFLPSTYVLDVFCPTKIELRLAQRICYCVDMFFLQDLTSNSDDQVLESFLDCLAVSINEKAWEIYSIIQETRKALELRKGNESRISQELVRSCSSRFSQVVEILVPFLFGKALDKYNLSAQPKHCTMKGLLNLIQLISEEGKEIHSRSSLKSLQLHKLEFFKNFIIFAASRGVGQHKLQDVMAHAKVVVTTAAYYSYMLWKPAVIDSTTRSIISSQYFSMLKVQLQVRKSFIRVLKALISSCSSYYIKMDGNILEDFIGSLLEDIRELLASKSNFTVSFMKIIIEELRFLRNFLIYKRHQGRDLEEELADLMFDVIREAGILSYSLSGDNLKEASNRDTNPELSNWMDMVQLLNENVAKKYPETARYKYPMTNELGFMDSLLVDLKELIRYNPDSIAFAQGQLDVVLEDLAILCDFLRDTVKQRNEHEELKALWFRVVDVAYKSEFVINSLVVGDPSPDCSPTSFNTIKEEIKKIRAEVEQICMGKSLALNTPKISNQPSRSSNPTMDEVVVGFKDEAEKIIDRLEANSAELDIVSIVGMPGQGKTTLAKKVYNDIRSHFHVYAWCCVSQGYQKRKLLLDLLSDELPTRVDKMSDEDLEKVLYQSLKGRRYLIVLDDVWDIEAWHGLQSSFPNDYNQSRILITSRIHLQVKPESEPHFLRSLNDDESRELLQKKLFHNKGCPVKLQKLGMKIVEICKGLPLAVVTVGGILATMEQDSWEEFAKSLTTSLVSDTEQCTELLEMSYIHLPDYLKPCLLYFGSFLQDEEISVNSLKWLWMAEGFVQKTTDEKSLENVAEDYLKDLINRSLVMVVKQTSRGGIKACSVHDLVHQFCVTRAKEENFLHLLNLEEKTGPLSEPCRLCISSWEDNQCFRHLSFLKFFPHHRDIEVSSILCSFKILKVLDLRGVGCSHFPAEVVMLVHLRFLALEVGRITSIPSTIVKLWNLETFLLRGSSREILLPYSLLNMTKLRHMLVNTCVVFSLPEQNLLKCIKSCNLETFSTPLVSSKQDMAEIIRKMPNLRKLKCTFFGSRDPEEAYQFPALNFLSQLESLKVHSTGKVQYGLEFSFHENLKRMTLSNFALSWTLISRFAQLPKLEVLKLLNIECEGKAWDMKEEVFTKLQFLKFEYLDIVNWNACSDNFPCLQHLILHRCWKLKEIPSSVGEIDSLETIEVKYCSHSIETSARNLKEGREGLKVFIH